MRRITIYATMIVSLLLAVPAAAEIEINNTFKDKLYEILSKPTAVYPLDGIANKVVFDGIDEFFQNHIDFEKAVVRDDKEDGRISYRCKVLDNKPVSTEPSENHGVESGRPFNIYYVKESQKRKFLKELSVPVRDRLSDQDAKRIGRNFVETGSFCYISKIDRMGDAFVVSRKTYRQPDENSQPVELTLLQRILFRRLLNDLVVANSKIIVDVHPKSKEIITFKSARWTPVMEKAGKLLPYRMAGSIIDEIEDAYRKTEVPHALARLEAAYYQNETHMFPIVVIDAEPKESYSSKREPIHRVLMISLVKNFAVDELDKDIIKPQD